MNDIKELNTESFEEFIEHDQPAFVDFWAEWCSPCRQVEPEIEAVAKTRNDFSFGKLNTDANADVAAAYDIRAIPTFAVFQDGQEIMRYSGVLREKQLNEFLDQAISLSREGA